VKTKLVQILLAGLVLLLGLVAAPVQAAQQQQQHTYYVLVPAPHRATLHRLKSLFPDVWVRRVQGKRYAQVGVFRDNSNARDLVRNLSQRGIAALINPRASQTFAQAPVLLAAIAPAPALPTAFATKQLPVLAVATPAPYVPMARVLVLAQDFQRNPELQQQFQGAFHRQWQGKTYIQVGAFSQTENLNQLVQSLQTQGVSTQVQQPEW